jgi:hypothetical protein
MNGHHNHSVGRLGGSDWVYAGHAAKLEAAISNAREIN